MSAGELLARSEGLLADWLREEGGERVDIEFMGVGLVQQFDPQLTRGGQRSRVIPPHETNSFMTKLRRAQVVPGWGAWTWCRLWMVAGEWVLHQECDWMREPVFEEPSIGEDEYSIELERYPRDPENIPVWLAERVAANERRKAANARRREARRARKERDRQAAQVEAAAQQGGDDAGQTPESGPSTGQTNQGGGGGGGSVG